MMSWTAEMITSRQNATVVQTHKLADRKHRKSSGLFRFDGVKLAAEALLSGLSLSAILLRASDADAVMARICELSGKSVSKDTRVLCLSDAVFDSLSEEQAPEGVICVANMLKNLHVDWSVGDAVAPREERILLLQSVRDPSNLGAIIRSAAALGVDRLVMSADCADLYSAKTVRASMGTLFSQKVHRVADLSAYIAALREDGRRVFAAALDSGARRLGDFDLRDGDCALIGNEGHGLDAEIIDACGHTVYIPMTDRAESLNAAVAAAILMWEFGRGRPNLSEK